MTPGPSAAARAARDPMAGRMPTAPTGVVAPAPARTSPPAYPAPELNLANRTHAATTQSNAPIGHTPEPRPGNHEGFTADQLNRAQLSGGLDKMLDARRSYWRGQR